MILLALLRALVGRALRLDSLFDLRLDSFDRFDSFPELRTDLELRRSEPELGSRP